MVISLRVYPCVLYACIVHLIFRDLLTVLASGDGKFPVIKLEN
jgi:hypothetical protein